MSTSASLAVGIFICPSLTSDPVSHCPATAVDKRIGLPVFGPGRMTKADQDVLGSFLKPPAHTQGNVFSYTHTPLNCELATYHVYGLLATQYPFDTWTHAVLGLSMSGSVPFRVGTAKVIRKTGYSTGGPWRRPTHSYSI